MAGKPNVTSSGQKELERAEKQFDDFKEQVDSLTLDRMNQAKVADDEPQTKIAQKDLAKTNEIYLKPRRAISSREKFNEDYREKYNYAKEYVKFIAENKEIIGETIEIWTKPFAGLPAEEWVVPCNKAVWGPRYLAEQLTKCNYHKFSISAEGPTYGYDNRLGASAAYTQSIVVDEIVPRITARPAPKHTSIFMGASNF